MAKSRVLTHSSYAFCFLCYFALNYFVFFFTAEALRVHLFICLVSLLAKTQKKFAATMCIWGVGPIQPILDVDPVHPARSELATCAATGWWSSSTGNVPTGEVIAASNPSGNLADTSASATVHRGQEAPLYGVDWFQRVCADHRGQCRPKMKIQQRARCASPMVQCQLCLQVVGHQSDSCARLVACNFR